MKSTNEASAFEPKSRQRRRTEAEAINFLDEKTKFPTQRRIKMIKRVRGAKQPLREANRIIQEALVGTVATQGLDFSDVQELRVRLIRRDLTLCPEQVDWLNRLDGRIAKKDMTPKEFKKEAAMLLEMPNSLPLWHRENETVRAKPIVQGDSFSEGDTHQGKPQAALADDFVYLGKYRWREGTLYRRTAPQVAA